MVVIQLQHISLVIAHHYDSHCTNQVCCNSFAFANETADNEQDAGEKEFHDISQRPLDDG